jgi:hypothetical protein
VHQRGGGVLAILLAGCGGGAAAEVDAALAIDAAPAVDAAPAFPPGPFEVAGHRYRFTISAAQAERMDWGGYPNPPTKDTFADDLTVTSALGGSQSFGKVGLRSVGTSTYRPWSDRPSLRVDADEFQPDQRIGGAEHIRLSSGIVGGLLRERIAYEVWEALGYPTRRSTMAWVEAPAQWGEGAARPYQVFELYKRAWCDRVVDGGCVNMWETVGDIYALRDDPDACQLDPCDNTRAIELANLAETTPRGPGFAAALASYIDWDRYRQFQCLSWLTGTPDDYVHGTNNLVVVERQDGLMQLQPYSTDISAGHPWYAPVRLVGGALLARGCQADPACWPALLTTCDALLDAFEDLDAPTTIIDPMAAEAVALGMFDTVPWLDDTAETAEVRAWYAGRAATLRADSVWDAVPCESAATCAGRADGRTQCGPAADGPVQLCQTP